MTVGNSAPGSPQHPLMKKFDTFAGMSFGIPFLALLISALPLSAGVIVDPTLTFGANAIDPAGEQTLDQDATNVTDESVLEALPELGAVQNFTGWNIQGTPTYIVFTDVTRPDVMGTYGTITGISSGGSTSNASLRTSPGNSIKINSGSTRNTTLTLDFGSATYDGTNVTAFDSAVNAPSAAGFTICGLDNLTVNCTVTFYGTDDTTVLSTQVLTKATDPDAADGATYGSDGYVGFKATGTGVASGIGKIRIYTNQTQGGGGAGIGIDDLAYTTLGKAYYMTPTGAGLMNGTSFTNALPKSQMGTTLNTTMVAGDTLYLGSGNYGTQAMDITSSGTATKPKRVIGLDTGAGKPIFTGTWVRTAPTGGTNHFISLIGSGGNGVSNWEFRNFDLTRAVFAIISNDITTGTEHNGLLFRDINITLVRHGMYMRDCDNMTVESTTVKSYSKHAFRLEMGCDNVAFKNCVADLSNGDSTWWDYSEAFAYGFIVNSGGAANTNIAFTDCIAANNLQNGQSATGFWNGDGFDAEANTVGLSFTRCIAINNEDAGFDCKQASTSNTTYKDCVSISNANNFKTWYGTVGFENCVSLYSRRRGPSTVSNDMNGIRIQDATVTINNCSVLGDSADGAEYGIAEKSAGTATVTNSIIAFESATGGFKTGSVTLDPSSVTFRPGSGVDPQFVAPSFSWDGFGNDMDNLTYTTTKGYSSTRL